MQKSRNSCMEKRREGSKFSAQGFPILSTGKLLILCLGKEGFLLLFEMFCPRRALFLDRDWAFFSLCNSGWIKHVSCPWIMYRLNTWAIGANCIEENSPFSLATNHVTSRDIYRGTHVCVRASSICIACKRNIYCPWIEKVENRSIICELLCAKVTINCDF